jgi:hypothetical protein
MLAMPRERCFDIDLVHGETDPDLPAGFRYRWALRMDTIGLFEYKCIFMHLVAKPAQHTAIQEIVHRSVQITEPLLWALGNEYVSGSTQRLCCVYYRPYRFRQKLSHPAVGNISTTFFLTSIHAPYHCNSSLAGINFAFCAANPLLRRIRVKFGYVQYLLEIWNAGA